MARRTKRQLGTAVLTVGMALAAVGCGATEKPSKEEYRDALAAQQEEIFGEAVGGQDEYLDCLIDGLYDELPVDMLRASVDSDQSYVLTEEDRKTVDAATQECVDELLSMSGHLSDEPDPTGLK